MSLLEAVLIMLAGMAAGTINTIVGSGTLITFPTLLAFGYPPVAANMSNSLGLVAGGFSGTWGYRKELKGASDLLKRTAPWSLLGATTGALLLLVLPEEAFSAIVPALIGLGVLLVVAGPWLQRRAAAAHSDHETPTRRAMLVVGTFGAGVYGGYFGAAQGVLLVGMMSVLLSNPLQQINGIKNVLGTIVNSVAAIVFLIVAWDQIEWLVALLIAIGALTGGLIGARIGRKLPPWGLRAFIVVVGVVAIVQLLRG